MGTLLINLRLVIIFPCDLFKYFINFSIYVLTEFNSFNNAEFKKYILT